MKSEVQFKLKELCEDLTFRSYPLFDNIVLNFRKEEDYNVEEEDLSGESGLIIRIGETKFQERALRGQMNDTSNDGEMVMIFKKNHPHYDDIIDFAGERVATMILANPTLDGVVRKAYPTSIKYDLYRSEEVGVFTMIDLKFTVESKFFLTVDD